MNQLNFKTKSILKHNIDIIIEILAKFNINLPVDIFIIKIDHKILFILSAQISLTICILQSFFGLKGIKEKLLLGYKGISNQKAKTISAVSLATGCSHFSGFLVGFLINGFLFIFLFFFLVFFSLYFLFKYLSNQILKIFLIILPVLVIFVIKLIFDYICSKFIFLQGRGKYLALDNYRAYSIFVYVTFFFDCFSGYITALLRLVVGFVGSLLFMPRIGYNYLGSQIEDFDAGFEVFNGFLNMEIGKVIELIV